MVFGIPDPPPLRPSKWDTPETEAKLLEYAVPSDPRFPNTNQTRYCYTSYLDFHRCSKKHSEDYPACQYYKKVFSTICPTSWIEKWDTQREENRFPGNI